MKVEELAAGKAKPAHLETCPLVEPSTYLTFNMTAIAPDEREATLLETNSSHLTLGA